MNKILNIICKCIKSEKKIYKILKMIDWYVFNLELLHIQEDMIYLNKLN